MSEQNERTVTRAGVLKAVTGLWAAVSLIQFTVWLLVCLIGWHFASPWWLWTVVIGGAVIGGLWVAFKPRGDR